MVEIPKNVLSSEDGMDIYDYIVNHVGEEAEIMPALTERLGEVDLSGQFLCSTARFLYACDPETYAPYLAPLISKAIERDKERRYIGSLLEAIWGKDYEERADQLVASDDNFRRIYKRIFQKV